MHIPPIKLIIIISLYFWLLKTWKVCFICCRHYSIKFCGAHCFQIVCNILRRIFLSENTIIIATMSKNFQGNFFGNNLRNISVLKNNLITVGSRIVDHNRERWKCDNTIGPTVWAWTMLLQFKCLSFCHSYCHRLFVGQVMSPHFSDQMSHR